jgi:putative trwL4 protein
MNQSSRKKQRDELQELRRQHRILVIRNWLNSIFIVLALLAIAGVLYFKAGERGLMISYGIGVLAVLIKMVEAMFRMPGIFNKL